MYKRRCLLLNFQKYELYFPFIKGTFHSLEGVLEQSVVLVHLTVLNPERNDSPHIINTLHRRLPALLQLSLVLGSAAGQETDLEVAESPEDGETENENQS